VRPKGAYTRLPKPSCPPPPARSNMRNCKYVHYRPDPEPDMPGMGAEMARLRAAVPK
jgi:hypothetical protein